MSVRLEDYRCIFERASPEIHEALEGIFHEAARIMSPTGLRNYLEGGRGLCDLRRGHHLVITYLEEMPLVVEEVGEDVIPDIVTAAMKLSSMTSGEVVGLMFSSLPTAARRLGDPDLLRAYLQFVHQLSAKASRGLRPMLNHMDELLCKLTLGGLRRWANFGAEAYRRDLANLHAYFNLETADSVAMLKQERRGTLFVDVQRKLNFYLRAFWGRNFYLRPAQADSRYFKSYIEGWVLHLPDALDDLGEIKGLELFRATAAHGAAHLAYTSAAITSDGLSPAQKFFIGLLEDARVEYHAIQAFPGLKRAWRSLLTLPHSRAPEHHSLATLEHMALMLLDDSVGSTDSVLAAIAAKFHGNTRQGGSEQGLSRRLGLELFDHFATRREVPSLRILEHIRIPYRDDNRIVWHFDERAWADGATLTTGPRQVRRNVSVMEMVNELDCELAGDDAQEIWTLSTRFWRNQERQSVNELEGKEPVSGPFHYPEWDYQIQLHRPDWASVFEHRPPRSDPRLIDEIVAQHRPIAQRIKQIIDKLQPQGVIRERNLEDGEEIDLNAAVDAMVAIRLGRQPNPRISMRNIVKNRDLAVLVLLDLSESTNERITGTDKTILALTREACSLVAAAIDGIGDPFAIHGFASNGRHDVRYYRFKDFDERFDDQVKSRLAGMRGGLSTRMGAAMRHAGRHLLRQSQRRKLLLLVTDGEPADIDERDPQHLRLDTKKAVEELHGSGILSYCLTLDPNADSYVQRIFGLRHYTVMDHVQHLPEKLPMLFATLTA